MASIVFFKGEITTRDRLYIPPYNTIFGGYALLLVDRSTDKIYAAADIPENEEEMIDRFKQIYPDKDLAEFFVADGPVNIESIAESNRNRLK
ncbi:MAG: hypothetical protein AABX16_01340 [Nanoarchaeota archaeon]